MYGSLSRMNFTRNVVEPRDAGRGVRVASSGGRDFDRVLQSDRANSGSSVAAPGLASPAPVPTVPPPSPPAVGNPFLGTGAYVPPVAKPSEQHAPWAPYSGPRDSRDELPSGGGKTSASGAPVITLAKTPASNQYGYTGPAARNPYFTSPSNPLRAGYVLGFGNWFEETHVLGGIYGPTPMNKAMSANAEGAQEALRLIQQHFPDASIVSSTWGSEGGPFAASKPTLQIALGDGRRLNAGGILTSYYNAGEGVTTASDTNLRRMLGLMS